MQRERLTARHEDPGRIESLTDGVFAVAMTLLVLDLVVKGGEATTGNDDAALWMALNQQGIGWKFVWFLAGFAVTSFWYVGHLLVIWTVEKVDRVAIWINIGFLLPIVLVPFTTSLLGNFPHATLAGTLYVLDILAISLMLNLFWFYCQRASLISPRTTVKLAKAIGNRLKVVTILLVADSLFAIFVPYVAIVIVLVTMLYVVWTAGSRFIVEER